MLSVEIWPNLQSRDQLAKLAPHSFKLGFFRAPHFLSGFRHLARAANRAFRSCDGRRGWGAGIW